MFRIAVIPPAGGLPAAIRCLRAHTDLPVGELRARLTDGRPVVEFPFDGDTVPEVRRCRALLRDLGRIGAAVRVYERVEGYPEEEGSAEFLRNAMRQNVRIAKDQRDRPG